MRSQHIILDALESAVWEAVTEGRLDRSVYDNAPKSHVFTPEPGECWDEDDVAAIKAVGQNDLAAKIRYYSQVLDGANA